MSESKILQEITSRLKEAAELRTKGQLQSALAKYDSALDALAAMYPKRTFLDIKSSVSESSSAGMTTANPASTFLFDPVTANPSTNFTRIFISGLINRISCFSMLVTASQLLDLCFMYDAALIWINYSVAKFATDPAPLKSTLTQALVQAARMELQLPQDSQSFSGLRFQANSKLLRMFLNEKSFEQYFDHIYRGAYQLQAKAKDTKLCMEYLDKADMFRAAKHLADDKAPIVSANLIATISLYCKCVLKEKMMDLFAQLCECLARYSENVSLMRPSSDAQLCVASLGYLTHSVCVITALGEGAIPKVSVDALERSLAASVYSIRPSFSANSSLFDKSSKKVTDLYDGYLRWHQSLTELRWLVSKQLSAVCSRDNRSNPLISNKCYEYLEELLTVHGKIVAAGLDADSASQKSATDSKWAPARSNCWESLCYAGVMSMEGSRTASVETLLSYADRAVEQVTTKADSYQGQVQGLSFVANFLCVTPLPRASVRSLTYGFAEDFTTRRSCGLLERAASIAASNRLNFLDKDKIPDRYKIISRCKLLSQDSKGALATAEEAVRKAPSLDLNSISPYVLRFVNVKLQSEPSKDALCDVTLVKVLKSHSSKPTSDQLCEVLLEESRLYGRGRRFRHQVAVSNVILDITESITNGTKYLRAKALLDKCFALHQIDSSDQSLQSALSCAEQALDLLKSPDDKNSMRHLDDLATASAMVGILNKISDDSRFFKDGISSQTKPERVHVDGVFATTAEETLITTNISPVSQESALKPLEFAVEIWTDLLGGMRLGTEASLAANRREFRAPDRTLRLMQIMCDIFMLLGRTEYVVKMCKLQVRLHRSVLSTPDSGSEIISLYLQISDQYDEVGAIEMAQKYWEKGRAQFKQSFATLDKTQKLAWLLSVTKFDPTSEIDERMKVMSSVQSEASRLAATQRTASAFALLARAKSLHAEILRGEGDIDEAVVTSLESRRLRLSLLPRQASASTQLTADRYRALASYFDSVFQVGTLHELQGSAREAEYYFLRGLELACSIQATNLQRRFLLKLAHVSLKRKRWADIPDNFNEPDRPGAPTFSIADGIRNAERKSIQGDLELQRFNRFDSAVAFYRQAEETLLRYMDSSTLKLLELFTSTVAAPEARPVSKKMGSFFSPRSDKILQRNPKSDSKRLSIEPPGESAENMLLLKQMQVRSRSKLGLVDLKLAVETLAPSHLNSAREIFLSCIKSILDIYPSSKAANRDMEMLDLDPDFEKTPFDLDLAFLLYQLSRVDFISLSWPINTSSSRTNVIDTIWDNRGSVDGRLNQNLDRISRRLELALRRASRAGSPPALTADICHLLAVLSGTRDPKNTARMVHFSLGLTLRHQALASVYDRIAKHSVLAKRNSQPTVDQENTIDNLAAAFAELTLSSASSTSRSDTYTTDDEIEIKEDVLPENTTEIDAVVSLKALEQESNLLERTLDHMEDPTNILPTQIEGTPGNPALAAASSWVVVSLSVATDDPTSLLITRISMQGSISVTRVPLQEVQLPDKNQKAAKSKKTKKSSATTPTGTDVPPTNRLTNLRDRLESIMSQNTEMLKLRTTSRTAKDDLSFLASSATSVEAAVSNREFWQQRTDLDEKMRQLCADLDSLLGWRRVFLLGTICTTNTTKMTRSFPTSGPLGSISSNILDILIEGSEFLSDEELEVAVQSTSQAEELSTKIIRETVEAIRTEFERLSESSSEPRLAAVSYVSRGTNIVEKDVERPCRNPVILILDKNVQMFPWESCPVLINFPSLRSPIASGLNVSSAYYVINPSGDIKSSETVLKPRVDKLGWSGVIGSSPSSDALLSAISYNDIFLYAGHGGGHQYLSRKQVTSCGSRGLIMLMGCSSVAFADESHDGEYDCSGPAAAYLAAGCSALIGNLWTVTTIDLDNETEALVDWMATAPAEDTTAHSLLHAMPSARRRCKLRFLNGAALVYFGIPLFTESQLSTKTANSNAVSTKRQEPKKTVATRRGARK